MTTAHHIIHTSRNADEADLSAQKMTDNIDQDWEHEATIYTFNDGSALVISGGQVNAYQTKATAVAAVAA